MPLCHAIPVATLFLQLSIIHRSTTSYVSADLARKTRQMEVRVATCSKHKPRGSDNKRGEPWPTSTNLRIMHVRAFMALAVCHWPQKA